MSYTKKGHQDTFHFLNQGQSPTIAKISDFDQFTETINAFYTLGFSKTQVNDIINILAAILHLGNIKFHQKGEFDAERCDVSVIINNIFILLSQSLIFSLANFAFYK